MAETFKSFTKTNATQDITLDASNVYTVPSTNSTVAIVLGLVLANKITNVITVSVQIIKASGDDSILMKDVSVPNSSTLEVFQGQKLVLNGSDKLRVISNTASALDVTLSVLEIDST